MSEKDELIFLPLDNVSGMPRIRTGRKTTITFLPREVIADLKILLLDDVTTESLGNRSYTIQGNGLSLSGSSDATGLAHHRDVPAGYYTLTIDGNDYAAPTVPRDGPPFQVWVKVAEAEQPPTPEHEYPDPDDVYEDEQERRLDHGDDDEALDVPEDEESG